MFILQETNEYHDQTAQTKHKPARATFLSHGVIAYIYRCLSVRQVQAMKDPMLNSIIKILEDEYACHTIILYGSRARGDSNDISDYDVIGFSDEYDDVVRKAQIMKGEYLDLWIYPTQALNSPDPSMSRLKGGQVLKQKQALGDELLSSIDDISWQPAQEADKNLYRVWALKMLERAFIEDSEGRYRKHWLIYSLLDIYFMVHDLEFLGAKHALHWLQGNDPTFHASLNRLYESHSMVDLVAAVFQVIHKDSRFYLMRHGDADEEGNDQSRPISLKGRIALSKQKEDLSAHHFDLAITSTALRTKQTADILFSEQAINTIEAKHLYLPLFEDKNIFIKKDLESKEKLLPNDIMSSDSRQAWLHYAMTALTEIMKICMEHNATTTVVIAHGVVMNLMGYIIDPERKDLLHKSFSPGEGFWVK